MKRIERKAGKALLRKMITLLQLVTLGGLLAAFLLNKMLPMKYLAVIGGVLFGLWVICFALQFVKNKIHLAGVVLSIFLSILQFAGIFYLSMANDLMDDIGGARYKIDNMVVVVRAEDPAETLQDAAGYTFGLQYVIDQGNTKRMVESVEDELGTQIMTAEYAGIPEAAQALLDGEVQAVIYNEAYTAMIEETIEDYSSKVRIEASTP